MNYLKAIVLKLISSVMFAAMSALVRYAGEDVPVGQVVFFRAAFAIPPVVLIYALARRAEARGAHQAATRPCRARPIQRRRHVPEFRVAGAAAARGCDRLLVLVPADHVAFSAIFLKERVRLYRWSAVIIGFSA